MLFVDITGQHNNHNYIIFSVKDDDLAGWNIVCNILPYSINGFITNICLIINRHERCIFQMKIPNDYTQSGSVWFSQSIYCSKQLYCLNMYLSYLIGLLPIPPQKS